MFSRRFQDWVFEDNAHAAALAQRRSNGETVLDLTVSNPTRVGLAWDGTELAGILASAECRFYEPDSRGLRSCREHVAEHYREHGAAVAVDDLFLCASTSEGYAWAIKLLADSGDEILVPAPSYPLLQFLAGMENVTLAPYPLRFVGGRWRVDAEALEAKISRRTRAIFCVSPNNPTGSVLDGRDREVLRAAAARHGLALIVDEVFLDFPKDAAAPVAPPVLRSWAAETEVPVLALNGMSKLALLPQIKLAWIALAGPAAWRTQARQRLELVADTYLSVNAPAQLAAGEIFARAADMRTALLARVQRNETLLQEWSMAASAGHRPLIFPREAGWSAMLGLPAGVDEERATLDLIRSSGVAVHPGYFYDVPEDASQNFSAFWVLSLITPENIFADAISRMDATLARV